MSDNIAIKVDNVSKTFKLPHEKNTSIKGAVVNFYKRNKSFEVQKALEDISFEVKKGEFFGIVGRNGSGKSTLLKMLAGIYSPSKGAIQVNGKLTPFIELGVGFNMELTGRENVFLNGALLGFNRKEMEAMYDKIVEFAELERFMDQKLKNYSSGMQVRLAFSIAIRAESDILLIDEVLAVGDAAFQQKCYEVFSRMKGLGRTIVLVTHDMSAVLRFCDRAMLIQDGALEDIDTPKDIADEYLKSNYENSSMESSGIDDPTTAKKDKLIKLTKVALDGSTRPKTDVEVNNKTRLTIFFENPNKTPLQFGIQIFNENGNYCFGTNTTLEKKTPTTLEKGCIDLEVKLELVPGNYTITAAIMNVDATKSIVYMPKAKSFRITRTTEVEGIANLSHTWERAQESRKNN